MTHSHPHPPPPPRSLAAEAARLGPWFHNLHLPDGTQTRPDSPLGDFPANMWRHIAGHIPQDLTGWTALDIGCNSGFYSFDLARRGARVTAIDIDDTYLAQARWAARQFGLEGRVTFREQQVYDLAHSDQQWDLVLFMGVFYHLRYPQLALDAVARCVRRLMVFQSLSMPGEDVAEVPEDGDLFDRDAMLDPGWPKLAFIERQLAGDRTNWWAPNHAACLALLRSAGLRVVGHPATETYLCQPDPDGPSSMWGWDAAEFEIASGRRRG